MNGLLSIRPEYSLSLIGVVRAAPTLLLLLPDPQTINNEEDILKCLLKEQKEFLCPR